MVTIGIPTHGDIKSDTVLSLLALQLPVSATIVCARGTYVHKNRNKLVTQAQDNHSTHLMFIDSDMVFPPDGVKRLLALEKDIVGGLYNRRELPLKNTVEYQGDYIPEIPFRCDSVATGFMLININVFSKLEKPYFFFDYDGDSMQGEDVYFCSKARENGYEIWCDPSFVIRHIGDHLY